MPRIARPTGAWAYTRRGHRRASSEPISMKTTRAPCTKATAPAAKSIGSVCWVVQLRGQYFRRLGERGAVPGEVPAADERGPGTRPRLRSVVPAEGIRLVGEDHQRGVDRGDLLPRQPRVAVGVGGEDVADAEPGEHVAGEGVPAEH